MKTKEQIFGPSKCAEDFVPGEDVYSKVHAFRRADEYAEEYAKAAIIWYMGWVPEHDWVAIKSLETTLLHFKESLKK